MVRFSTASFIARRDALRIFMRSMVPGSITPSPMDKASFFISLKTVSLCLAVSFLESLTLEFL